MYKIILKSVALTVLIQAVSLPAHARDFEGGYAAYGAGAKSCSIYLKALKKGGRESDYFADWLIGYLSAFNVIMPNTYNILGESSFASSQEWLVRNCRRYPKELFVNAAARLTETLYPMRYQSSLKNTPEKVAPKPKLGDIKKFVK